jgi:hypothetical protein
MCARGAFDIIEAVHLAVVPSRKKAGIRVIEVRLDEKIRLFELDVFDLQVPFDVDQPLPNRRSRHAWKRSEKIIHRPVLLHDEDDVLDRREGSRIVRCGRVRSVRLL